MVCTHCLASPVQFIATIQRAHDLKRQHSQRTKQQVHYQQEEKVERTSQADSSQQKSSCFLAFAHYPVPARPCDFRLSLATSLNQVHRQPPPSSFDSFIARLPLPGPLQLATLQVALLLTLLTAAAVQPQGLTGDRLALGTSLGGTARGPEWYSLH